MKALYVVAVILFATSAFRGIAQSGIWTIEDTLRPIRRYSAGSVLDGKLYAIGGQGFFSSLGNSSEIIYDPVAGMWDSSIAQIPVDINSAAASVVKGKLYVIGGKDNSGVILGSVYEYDPMTNNWTRKTEMPSPRFFLRSVVFDDKIYALGGRYYPQTVEMYDPATDTWTTKTSMFKGRYLFAAEALDGKIYAMGGLSSADPPHTSSVEKYDPKTDTWTEIDSMPGVRLMHGSGVINGQIYVFGGAGNYPPTWKFDPVEGAWSDIDADMPVLNAGFASYVASDARGVECIYTIGGAGGDLIPNGLVLKFCPLVTATKHIGKTPPPVALYQNNPNPFSSYTTFKYELKNSGEVRIKIFNLAGQEVATLQDGFQPAGEYTIKWNVAGLGERIYFYQLQTATYSETKKCVLMN